jgi:hypothetical protein
MLIWETQKPFSRALQIVIFFLLESLKIRGATSLGRNPSNQAASQKRACFPFPIVTQVAAPKSSWS